MTKTGARNSQNQLIPNDNNITLIEGQYYPEFRRGYAFIDDYFTRYLYNSDVFRNKGFQAYYFSLDPCVLFI